MYLTVYNKSIRLTIQSVVHCILPSTHRVNMSKRKSTAQLYAERYSYTGYPTATTHTPQIGPNVILQDNTWELTREIKILPQPFVNPGGAAMPSIVAETCLSAMMLTKEMALP